MTRIDIINTIIKRYGFKSYLEIGVSRGDCIRSVNCSIKVGVDPEINSAADIKMTSDEYFDNVCKEKFDLVFIDGKHLCEQVYKDIENSLKHLSTGGVIVLHDCLPTEERIQTRDQPRGSWTGDVWKAVSHYFSKSRYACFTVDTDWGCGIIDTGMLKDNCSLCTEEAVDVPEDFISMTWDRFSAERDSLLNTVTENEFLDYTLNRMKESTRIFNKDSKLVVDLRMFYKNKGVLFASNGWCNEGELIWKSMSTYSSVTDDIYIADSTNRNFYSRDAFIDIFTHGIRRGFKYIIYIDSDCLIVNHDNLKKEFVSFVNSGKTFSGPSDGGVICHRNMNRLSFNPFILFVNLDRLRKHFNGKTFDFLGIQGYSVNNVSDTVKKDWKSKTECSRLYRESTGMVVPHADLISHPISDRLKRRSYNPVQTPWSYKDDPWGEPYYDIFLGYLNKGKSDYGFMYTADYPFNPDRTGITSAVYAGHSEEGKSALSPEDVFTDRNLICLHTWFARLYNNYNEFNLSHVKRIDSVHDYAISSLKEYMTSKS